MRRALRLLPLLLATVGGAALAARAERGSTTAQTPTQLPRGVRPLHYDVSLEPDAAAARGQAPALALAPCEPSRFSLYVVSAFRRTSHGPAKAGHYVLLEKL